MVDRLNLEQAYESEKLRQKMMMEMSLLNKIMEEKRIV